jgi:hypothetical protein
VINNVFEESAPSVSSLKMELKGKVVQPHTMKPYIEGVEVQLLSCLTKVLDGYELAENWFSMFLNNGNLTVKSAVCFGTMLV